MAKTSPVCTSTNTAVPEIALFSFTAFFAEVALSFIASFADVAFSLASVTLSNAFDFVELYPGKDPSNTSGHVATWMSIYLLVGLTKFKFNLK